MAESNTYRFEKFTLNLDSRRLAHGTRIVPLVPKAFDLLVILVEARPRVLSKAELHRRLWPKTYVSDASLSVLVTLVRQALGDDAREPRFIRTVHRIGYAFAGTVKSDPPLRLRRQPSTSYWLTFPNRQLALTDGGNVIGRDASVDVPLQFPGVSRRHARIVVSASGVMIEDLGSKNGTWLHGRRITSPSVLEDGDQLRIGSMVVTFRAATAAMSTATETTSRT